jgi:NADH-quinone oxidoreductase subunit L
MAGVIAVVQTDIKKIIAYSTMSQIGYMFAAVGVGEYAAGMFHLLTHAFFKALLFLGAGIVIHALANEQDVRRMGGLSKVMPHTTKLMWVGTIALIGFFPLSKDEILSGAMEAGSTTAWIVWAGGLIGAFFTGLYATRLMRLVFYGEMSDFAKEHLHKDHGEAPWTMFWPVCVLAAGAIISGFLALGFGFTNFFADFLANTAPDIEASVVDDTITTAISWTVSIIGAVYVWKLYATPGRSAALRQRFGFATTAADHKFYWDELYDTVAYRPAAFLATWTNRVVEEWIIGGSVKATAFVVGVTGRLVAEAQTGVVREYAVAVVLGALVVGAYLLNRASL